MATRSSVAVLLVMATCLLMAGGVHGNCCSWIQSNGLKGCRIDLSDKADCDTLKGSFRAGSDWKCGTHFRCIPKTCQIGSACDDPHIFGFDGSSYMLWGQKDTTYDLLSERNHQVNVRLFDKAPPAGSSATTPAHALFIDAAGIMINDARITVRMITAPAAGATADGIEPELAGIISATSPVTGAGKRLVVTSFGADGTRRHVVWTGKPTQDTVDSHTSVAFMDEKRVTISSSEITLAVVLHNDHHLDVQTTAIAVSWSDVHGVLGQTYAAAFVNGAAAGARGTGTRKLDGKEEDYITSGLLSADDKFSRFVVGGSKLHDLVGGTTAARKMLKTVAAGMVVGDHGQSVVNMVRSDAGMMGGR